MRLRQSGAFLFAIVLIGACADRNRSDSIPATADAGHQVAIRSGCSACHGVNGEGLVAPAWAGLYGSAVELKDGTEVTADAAYLERSIRKPDEQIVKGYGPAMPTIPLSDAEVQALLAYIESLAKP